MILSELVESRFAGQEAEVRQLNPLILASVGDAYYSLIVRSGLVAVHDLNANTLHKKAASVVCAAAQKESFFRIEPSLTENEQYIARRGRNTHPGTVPKNATVADYRIATAFEAVLGYLYLSGQEKRALELIELAGDEQNENV